MKKVKKAKRRQFLKDALTTATGMSLFPLQSRANYPKEGELTTAPYLHQHLKPMIRFSVIGLNHGHIYGQTNAMLRSGGELVSVYAKEQDLLQGFSKRYPDAQIAESEVEILEDENVQLVLSAGIPIDRAPLGIRAMQHGKDYMSDKPGIITLEQLVEVRKVQAETQRIYSIMYSERLENQATVKAGELVKSGAIGEVVQTIGLGPHRIRLSTRPDWFYDKKYFGGIICDIGSH